MNADLVIDRRPMRTRAAALILAGIVAVVAWTCEVNARGPNRTGQPCPVEGPACLDADGTGCADWAGTWYWLRSPEQEKQVMERLYDQYCIRCHGVDGRGVWDIPDVPDFTNIRWQECRSEAQLARLILQGRGAVMPAFRGTFTLEEAWAMARHLRSFDPRKAVSKPDDGRQEKQDKTPNKLPEPGVPSPEKLPNKPAPSLN